MNREERKRHEQERAVLNATAHDIARQLDDAFDLHGRAELLKLNALFPRVRDYRQALHDHFVREPRKRLRK